MTVLPGHEDSDDYDSSSSSITTTTTAAPTSSRRSLGSSSTVSVRSSSTTADTVKPHKANQAEWEAIVRLRSSSGPISLDSFRIIRRLGSGDLGNVYLCQLRSTSCLYYAMKVVDREALAIKKKIQRAETEKEILRVLDHPFLPTLYADFDASRYSCLVMEFCPGGDLHVARQRQVSRRFGVASAKFYAAETVLALEYLHMMGVVYRDLKPENVLVRDDGHIMLSDFDLSLKCDVVPKLLQKQRASATSTARNSTSTSSCITSQPVLSCFYGGGTGKCIKKQKEEEDQQEADEDQNSDHELKTLDPELIAEPVSARSKSFVGTHEYLAPEVISGGGHGSAVDWWTLGVFLYEMIYGRTPFRGESNEKTLINIMKQPLSFPSLNVSNTKELEEILRAQDLIRRLLVKHPKRRLGGLKGSVEIKSHEFFKGVNWALIRSVKPPEVPRDLRKKAKCNRVIVQKKLSKKEREEPFSVPHHFDYF